MSTFNESQKQYLSGLVMGADVARAIRGLPVINGGASSAGALSIRLGPDGASVGHASIPGERAPQSPDRLAHEAQSRVIASGGRLSKEEVAKREKNALDLWDAIEAQAVAGAFPKGTNAFLWKYQGLFHVAPAQDAYMCRLRIPGGSLRSWQISGLADLVDQMAGGYVDVTTRANLQIREIPADRAMEILYRLREMDIICLGSGADNIRNCTSSPLSGFDRRELIETLPWARRMHHYILNHREMYGLPRKFNIAFDGGGTISSLDDTNDIGFHAVTVATEHASDDLPAGTYFQLRLGGITGHRDFARDTGVLVAPKESVALAAAIVRVFIQFGDRTDRKKARLKYVLDAMGFDQFLQHVEAEYGRPLCRVASDRISVQHAEDRGAHIGFHAQRQVGLSYVGLVLPVGRVTANQLRGLAAIADRYGSGEVRLTVWQNLIIPNIDDASIPAVQAAIEAIELDWRASAYRAGLVACTGNVGCKFASADTKGHAMQIAAHLEATLPRLEQSINIHLTGCHHSCAQHYIGDIGLIARPVERADDMVEGYDIYVGGGWGCSQSIGRLLFESITADSVAQTVCSIVAVYQRNRREGERFCEFARRHSEERLRALAATAATDADAMTPTKDLLFVPQFHAH